MILYVLGWNADILHYYAIYMPIALIFLHAKTRNIISAIMAVLAVTLVLQLVLDYTAGWDFNTYSYTDFYSWRGFVRNLLFNGFHPVFPWISFMLVGIVVVRIDLSDKTKLVRLLVSSLAIALGAELASALLLGLFNNSETAQYLFAAKPMNPSIMYMIAGRAWALSVISVCLLVGNILHDRLNWLARCGQMALTHYVFHSVVVLGLFEAFNGIAARSGYFVFGLSITVFLIMLFFSNVWLKFFKRGPLELLMRRLS